MKKLILIPILFWAILAHSSEQMIEIAVEITEVNENKSKELGIKWADEISALESNIPSIIESGVWERTTKFSAALKVLEANGAAKVLSKPKLVTKSGTSAKFMVGGEFPIVAAAVGTSRIDWKEYGIIMEITPTFVKDNKIDIVINTELSRLDYNAPLVDKYPVISKRQASSHLQVKDGETMILAGLIETTKGKTVKGIPFLRSIPILGVLFSTTKNTEIKTNVLIFITPKLIEK
ncbi:MAG: type II and III secretion system protein [Endomicrobium sp.]|jgi:pilus assembly protein CpaC|nr:type II and III secretion system protein [Endomicrobium sp.]